MLTGKLLELGLSKTFDCVVNGAQSVFVFRWSVKCIL
jgi:hypothetical protein